MPRLGPAAVLRWPRVGQPRPVAEQRVLVGGAAAGLGLGSLQLRHQRQAQPPPGLVHDHCVTGGEAAGGVSAGPALETHHRYRVQLLELHWSYTAARYLQTRDITRWENHLWKKRNVVKHKQC